MPCIDIIVVKHRDGNLKCFPFFVYFQNAPQPVVEEGDDGKVGIPSVYHTLSSPSLHDSFSNNKKKMTTKKGHHYIQIELNGVHVDFPEDDSVRMVLKPNDHFAVFEKKKPVIEDGDSDSEMELSRVHDTAAYKQLMKQKRHLRDKMSGMMKRVTSHQHLGVRKRVKNRWLKHMDEMAKKLGEEFTTPPKKLLERLDWDQEVNTITFINPVTGERVSGRLFLWEEHVKMIVSDIDGTITRSDIKGQIATRWLKMQYAHPGVATLFQLFRQKGYRLVYLTVRSINQEATTIEYINKLRQGESGLPLGPVITPPMSGHSIMRWRMPCVFKIHALNMIKSLFPDPHYNPLVAGWGNRDTDKTAYLACGIKPERIWLINKKGVVTTPMRDENTQKMKLWTGYTGVAGDFDSIALEEVSEKVHERVIANLDDPHAMQKLTEKVMQAPSPDELQNEKEDFPKPGEIAQESANTQIPTSMSAMYGQTIQQPSKYLASTGYNMSDAAPQVTYPMQNMGPTQTTNNQSMPFITTTAPPKEYIHHHLHRHQQSQQQQLQQLMKAPIATQARPYLVPSINKPTGANLTPRTPQTPPEEGHQYATQTLQQQQRMQQGRYPSNIQTPSTNPQLFLNAPKKYQSETLTPVSLSTNTPSNDEGIPTHRRLRDVIFHRRTKSDIQ